jgi:hypothetical protein
MGEYWKPINTTKREFVHPHRLGDGLKYAEWVEQKDGRTWRAVLAMIAAGRWSEDDDIRAASDAGSDEQLYGTTDVTYPASELYEYTYNDSASDFADVSKLACELIGVPYESSGT